MTSSLWYLHLNCTNLTLLQGTQGCRVSKMRYIQYVYPHFDDFPGDNTHWHRTPAQTWLTVILVCEWLNWHWLFCSWSKFGIYMAGSWNGDQQTWRFGRQSGKRRKDRGCDILWTSQEPQPQPGATGGGAEWRPAWGQSAPARHGAWDRDRERGDDGLRAARSSAATLRGSKAEASSTSNSSWCFWRCVYYVYCKCSTFRFPPMLWHGMIEVYEWVVFS